MDKAGHTAAMKLLPYLWEKMHWPGKWRQYLRSMGELSDYKDNGTRLLLLGECSVLEKEKKRLGEVINQQLKAKHENQP